MRGSPCFGEFENRTMLGKNTFRVNRRLMKICARAAPRAGASPGEGKRSFSMRERTPRIAHGANPLFRLQ
jgi:hypothetical protein